jgi:hypothetical protein
MSSNLTLSQYLQQQNGNLTPELAQVKQLQTHAKPLIRLCKKVLWQVF